MLWHLYVGIGDKLVCEAIRRCQHVSGRRCSAAFVRSVFLRHRKSPPKTLATPRTRTTLAREAQYHGSIDTPHRVVHLPRTRMEGERP
jgi:hypothetical protein